MVIVFENDKRMYDFVVQTSVAFALAKLNHSQSVRDERVLPFSSTLDLSAVTGLALCGHGKPGAIQSWSAKQIAAMLVHDKLGVTRALKKLIVTACYAGSRVAEEPGTSTVEVLASKLRGRGLGGLEIVGYNGPSIKNAQLGATELNPELGFFAKVVNDPTPGSVPDSAERTKAFGLQNAAKLNSGVTFPVAVGTTANLGQLGSTAATATKVFYEKFIDELDKANLLLNGDDVARVCVVID